MSEPETKVEIWDIERLIPYEKNAKIHSEQQIEKLAASIRRFGWNTAISVWKDDVIIAGHGRRLAALKLGLKKVPVVVMSHLTKVEADALRLADNKVTSVDYDIALMEESLQEINAQLDLGDMSLLIDAGFDEQELNFTIMNDSLADMDESHFTDDVSEAVAEQARKNEQSIEATDDIAAPIGDAIGVKRVTIAQSRQISELMSQARNTWNCDSPAEYLIQMMRIALGERTA